MLEIASQLVLKGEMMIITKKRTKSGLVSEPTAQFNPAVVAVAIWIVAAVVLGTVTTAEAATITVNQDGSGDYTDIPDAVFAASAGDIISVAPGEYTGADLFGTAPGIKVRGSGPTTRIVQPGFKMWDGQAWAIWACAIYVDDGEISNLAIDLEDVGSDDFVYGIDIGWALNATVKDVQITDASYSISSWYSTGLRIEGNTITSQVGDTGILCYNSPNCVVTDNDVSGIYRRTGIAASFSDGALVAGNTIAGDYGRHGINPYMSPGTVVSDNNVSGSFWVGILASRSPNSDIASNTVSGNFRFSLYSYTSDWTVLADNVISGTGRCGIVINRVFHCSAVSNTIQDFRSTVSWGAPVYVQMSQGCDIAQNALINVYDHVNYVQDNGPIAGICVSAYGTWAEPCLDNKVRDNDHSESGLPGFKASATGFVTPGCVLLEAGWWGTNYGEAIDNTVDEGLFPVLDPHQSDVCNQVVDLTFGSNTIVGAGDCDSQAYTHLVNMLEHYMRMEELGVEKEEELPNFPYRNWPAKP